MEKLHLPFNLVKALLFQIKLVLQLFTILGKSLFKKRTSDVSVGIIKTLLKGGSGVKKI
jgi:hypothetical protein